MIELQHFSIGYKENSLLHEVNATIKKGQLTALIGRNGTGKSTLLRAIAGLNRCYSGKIILDGHDIACMKTEDMAKTLAVVTTERTRIANLRCKDVVAIGRAPYTNWIGRMQETDKEIVMQSLISVGMEAYANRTMDKMSDGECQRVMIARALAQDTPIILLDEPTSFLDMPNRYELVALLRRLVHDEKKCIMFSTHELDIALSMCDSIALLDTPNLSCLTASEMQKSGYIDRLFQNENIRFDSLCGTMICKYSINSLVYWVTYVHNVVYSFYRSMIYCYINSTQRCAGSIVIDIIPTNGADKRKFFPFAPYFPVTNVIKRYFYPYFPAIIGIKGYSFPYFPYLSGIMKIKTALYSLFSRLDWHKTVVFPCLGEIYEGIRSLSWEIPVT